MNFHSRDRQVSVVTSGVLTWRVFASAIVVVLILALSPVTTSAQTVASNFWELRFKVKPGDTVYVTDDAGREKKARILDLSPSSLLLSMEGSRRDLGEQDVMRIRQRLPDPLLNGAIAGAGIVMAVSIASRIAFADDGGTFVENMASFSILERLGLASAPLQIDPSVATLIIAGILYLA